ncbi:hypothetical protein PX699_25740 [Sphingobium sp. H39-3-25]|uniref:hypothetical protein n=1 Tax=Sphingobium arseniciresistens TaxID=3030834 RepID=UPI0023B96ED5|nr:hypothetical protein [Sphingobium arseniciresistens]
MDTGRKQCSNCGRWNTDAFCGQCGTEMGASQSSQLLRPLFGPVAEYLDTVSKVLHPRKLAEDIAAGTFSLGKAMSSMMASAALCGVADLALPGEAQFLPKVPILGEALLAIGLSIVATLLSAPLHCLLNGSRKIVSWRQFATLSLAINAVGVPFLYFANGLAEASEALGLAITAIPLICYATASCVLYRRSIFAFAAAAALYAGGIVILAGLCMLAFILMMGDGAADGLIP